MATLLESIARVIAANEEAIARRCDYCGGEHTTGEVEDKDLAIYYGERTAQS